MVEQHTLVFVEVRYRADLDYGDSAETVVWRKQRRLTRAAQQYLLESHLVDKVHARFDILGLDSSGEFNWIKNAFEVKY